MLQSHLITVINNDTQAHVDVFFNLKLLIRHKSRNAPCTSSMIWHPIRPEQDRAHQTSLPVSTFNGPPFCNFWSLQLDSPSKHIDPWHSLAPIAPPSPLPSPLLSAFQRVVTFQISLLFPPNSCGTFSWNCRRSTFPPTRDWNCNASNIYIWCSLNDLSYIGEI